MDRAYMVKQFVGVVTNGRIRMFVFTTGDEKYYLLDPRQPDGSSGCIQFPLLRRRFNAAVRAGRLRHTL